MSEPTWFRYTKGIITGTFAGITVTFLGHPLDTVKTRLQVQPQNNKIYNGVVDCLIKSLKWEGIGGWYRGVGSPLTGQILMKASLFTAFYESIQQLAKEGESLNNLKPSKYYIAGAIGGFATTFFDGPIDLFKSKLQVKILNEKMNLPVEYPYRNVFHCCYHIVSTYGLRGALQGFTPTLIRDVVGFSLYFGSFEQTKRLLLAPNQKIEELEPWKIILSGVIGGIIYWCATFNIDVVKSAIMADHVDPKKRVYKNMFDCAQKLYQNEGGYLRFWKGFTPCVIRGSLVGGMMLLVADKTRGYLPSYETYCKYFH